MRHSPGRAYVPPRRAYPYARPRARYGRSPRARAQTGARITLSVLWSVTWRVALIAAFAYVCYRAIFVLFTVLASALLAVTLHPVVNALSRPAFIPAHRRTRRAIAALGVFVLLAVLLWLSYVVLISPFLADAARLVKSIGHESQGWKAYLEGAQRWVNGLPPEVRAVLGKQDVSNLTEAATRFVRGILVTTVKSLSHILELVLIPVLAFYFIVEGRGLMREFAGLVPARMRPDALRIAHTTGRILRDYTVANLVLCLIAGVVTYAGLSWLGVPYALSLSVLAGVTRFVPVIGPIIAAIPIILFSLLQGPSVAAAVTVFFILLHLVESKGLLPHLVGDRLNIHGAVVLIALLLGGEFAGIVGMFFAAPLAALARVLLRTYLLRMRRSGPQKPGAKRTSEAFHPMARSPKGVPASPDIAGRNLPA